MKKGAPRKIKTKNQLVSAWESYKLECDNKRVLTHEFSNKDSKFISAELRKSITYTVEGFCVYIGLARAAFYATYAKDEDYKDIVTRIKEECEVDAREKFELGIIPSQLAPLWMSKHGYSVKQDTTVNATLDTEKSKLDKLASQMGSDG